MRQAVVLIHGIGEQKPMATLRGFVDAALVDSSGSAPSPLYSKPDKLSENFELRRLVAEKTRQRPTTDFFEFYWAHQMDGTTLGHVWPWIRSILLRKPTVVPKSLVVLWGVSWLLLVGTVLLFLSAKVPVLGYSFPSGSIVSLGLAALFFLLQTFAIGTIGDAARYLSATPKNIAIRQRIRSDGIALLRRLHERGTYDRIVVVGHSLGSVIGYDIITHLWDELSLPAPLPDRVPKSQIVTLQKAGKELARTPTDQARTTFRSAQHDLWAEQRALGFPWLVTDFVTLGSPLAHAAFLLAEDENDLRSRQEQRELPTCPPAEDDSEYTYGFQYTFQGQPRTLRRFHHAAPFAVTRWSNIFYPIRFGALGDWVGGPLRGLFGHGIEDIAIKTGSVRFVPLFPHLRYWRGSASAGPDGSLTAVGALRRALRLRSSDWLPRIRSAPQAYESAVADGVGERRER